MLARIRDHRSHMFRTPGGVEALEASLPKGQTPQWTDAGSVELFLVYRDEMDTFQDVYLLRTRGALPDEEWQLWVRYYMRIPTTNAAFRKVFESVAERGGLLPEFVAFYRPLFEGAEPADPLTT
jgi:hypothetical protein